VWWAVLAGLLVAGVVAVALTSGGGATSGKLEVAKSVAVDGSALPRFTSPNGDSAVGTRAPVLTGQTFNGSPIMVGGTGAPHVVVFVAHWCPHCQAEVPRIVSLQRAGKTDGVAVTAVATGTNANAPNYPPSAWLHGVGWPYPTLVDTASGTAAAAYGLTSYPYLVFVDASGNVAARVSGEVAPADLSAMFAALAAGKPVPVSVGGSASSG
jgi:thiol-disulfide isomerase/thioredoxin